MSDAAETHNADGRTRMVRRARHREIAAYVARHGSATVAELTQLLSASPGTVRKDLEALDQAGAVTRTHGGAISNAGFSLHEPPNVERIHQQVVEKEAIARLCIERFVADGDAIFLDAGTTTVAIAEELVAQGTNATVITNSLDVATTLTNAPTITLAVTGGEHRPGIASLVGEWVSQALSTIRVRTLFLGANAVSATAGISTPNLQEAAAKRAMIESADRIVVVADHTKLDRSSFGLVAQVQDVDALVTDEGADPAVLEELRQLGVQVDVARIASAGDAEPAPEP